MSTSTDKVKPATPDFKVRDVITLTGRLGQLLLEEVEHLKSMRIPSIETLQQEKLAITNMLDAQRRLLSKHPHLLDTIPSQDRQDLQEVVDIFNEILEENRRKLMQAREVNHQIVQAITHVVKENTQSRAYSARGITYAAPFETLSVTLNKTI